MVEKARIAVVGAGLIGRRHVDHVSAVAELAAIVDPTAEAAALAQSLGVPHHADLAGLLAAGGVDGAVIATPNRLHAEQGIACIAAGLPVLIEKPLAADVASGERLVAAAEAAGVPVLVGHHRRHNPLIAKAREAIDAGRLGRIVAAHVHCWLPKPDGYFDAAWRREPGAGPVLINLIHDIDLLRHLCGAVVAVQAAFASAARGNPVEDTAGLILRFASGAVGTLTVSDAVVAPWSWEMTAAENPAYPHTGAFSCLVGGTAGSLSIPDLALWHQNGGRDWWQPIDRESLAHVAADPLALQMRHFVDVIQNGAAPLVSGREGLGTLRVVAAAQAAAETGGTVVLGPGTA